MSLARLQCGSEWMCGSTHSFPRFWIGRVVSGVYPRGKDKYDVPQINSDSVNSFSNPHSIRKVPFTVSIPHNLTLTLLKL